MSEIGTIGLLLVIANIGISWKGFTSNTFFGKYKFEVDSILINKEYKRLLTSGFLHANWPHLLFNMVSLYAFCGSVEFELGGIGFLIIYFASLIGGDLLSLFIHRQHGDYSSVGASGAVCGVIFASIALFPGMGIGFFGLDLIIPGWIYGILFALYSIYGIKSTKTNVAHEAHLGGALVGMVVAVATHPSSLSENLLPILALTIPALAFLTLVIAKPEFLLIENYFFKKKRNYYTIEDKYNDQKINRQLELDRLLDKISKKGIDSLTAREKHKLKEYSK